MRSYKKSMETIKMSGALKEKILREAAAPHKSPKPRRLVYVRPLANIAACAVILLCAQMRLSEFRLPTQSTTAPLSPSAGLDLPGVSGSGALPTPGTGILEGPRNQDGPYSSPIPFAGPLLPALRPTPPTVHASGSAAAPEPVGGDTAKLDPQAPIQPQSGTPDAAPMGTPQPALTAPPQQTAPAPEALEDETPSPGGGHLSPDPAPQSTPDSTPHVPGGGGGGGGGSRPGGSGGSSGSSGIILAPGPGSYSSLESLRSACGFSFQYPRALPSGCSLNTMRLLEGGAVELTYSGSCNFVFRTAQGGSVISGDYDSYEEVSAEQVGARTVTFSGRGGRVYTATWTGGGMTYSITSGGLTPAQMRRIITGVQ